MAGYAEDLVASMKAQTEFIKKQVMLEVIQVAATCETYDEHFTSFTKGILYR